MKRLRQRAGLSLSEVGVLRFAVLSLFSDWLYALKIRGHNYPSDCCRFSPQALPFVTPIKHWFFLFLFNIDEKNLVLRISIHVFSTVYDSYACLSGLFVYSVCD